MRTLDVTNIGQVTAFSCGRAERLGCSTPGCKRNPELACARLVKRVGKLVPCGRAVCSGCAVSIDGKDHCGAHARQHLLEAR
ncbi:MAG TPA: hypothetical protein VG734_25620 [Lacunisphaera sp.]|nr:hypothetical protein [Lacunisphaera sp.]